jgi:hypothetical protein
MSENPLRVGFMHPVAARFRHNYQGFWCTFRWFILIFIIAQLSDALSTCYFMGKIGWQYEFHPLVKYAAREYGTIWGPMLSCAFKVVSGVAVAIYLRKYARVIFLATASTAACAAFYNVWSTTTNRHLTFNDVLAIFGY